MKKLISTIVVAGMLAGCAVAKPGQPTASANTPVQTAGSIATASPSSKGETETQAIDVKTLPGFVKPEKMGAGTYRKPMISGGWVEWTVFQGSQAVDSFRTEPEIAFGAPETYTDVPGVLAWRGNHARTAPAFGKPVIKERKLEPLWSQPTGSTWTRGLSGRTNPDKTPIMDHWSGSGWTGQPIIVAWPDEALQAMKLPEKTVEVLYPVFDGNVYRFDLATGKATKPPIPTKFAYKGTGLAHPAGLPLFFAGQGLDESKGERGPFEYRMFDLGQNRQVNKLPGADAVAPRNWGAFDSSALIHKESDTLLEVGENGLFYRVKLNSSFAGGTVKLDPKVTKMRWRTSASSRLGAESSLVAYRNLVYFSDNDGNLICVDANTLEIVWARTVGDDSDATMVLDETPDGVFLYHGNEVDHRGTRDTNSNLRKIDALTGKIVWQHDVRTVYNQFSNGGLLGSPALGRGDSESLVFFNVARVGSDSTGELIALDRVSGKPKWTRRLPVYSWSSPVIVQAEDGRSYGLLCDAGGSMQLFDPRSGTELHRVSVGANCESSPAVYNNIVVIGTWAAQIYAFKLK